MAFDRQNFVIYDEEFHTGAVETLERATIDLNASAGGTMSFVTENMKGEFLKESFFKDIDGLVRDRDPNDITDSAADDLTMGEEVGVKIHKSIHVEKTLNAFAGIGSSPEELSFVVGQIQGKRMSVDYLDTGIASVAAVLQSNANVIYDATATSNRKTISPVNLNRMKKRLGDQSQRIRALVMDSTMFHDLVEENIEAGLTDVAGVVVYGGMPATTGLPVIVTDSEYLQDPDPAGDGTEPAEHYILALTEGAVTLYEAEDRNVLSEVVGGKKNLIGRIQTEYALMPTVSGAAYTGSQHPTTADLADSANWNYVVQDKAGAGVLGKFNAIEDLA